MLQVLFLILKIIGIVLASLLGLVLLALLAALFVPFRYRAYGLKRGGECRAEAKLSWFLHLVSVPIRFENGALSARVKLFGFPVMDLLGDEEAPKKAEKASKRKRRRKKQSEGADTLLTVSEPLKEAGKEPEESKGSAQEEPGAGAGAKTEAVPADIIRDSSEENAEESTGIFRLLSRFLKAVVRFFAAIPKKLKNLKCTFRRFCGKIKRMVKKYRETKAFALDERTKAAVRLVLKESKRLVRHVLPRKIRGELHFGTSDPALTGQILGVIGIFYPLFMDNVKVEPDFEQEILEGELFFKGRIRLAALLRTAWRLYRDKNVRFVYRRFSR